MRYAVLTGFIAVCAVATVSQAQVAEKASGNPALMSVKSALDKYQDPIVAVREGFFSTQACVGFADGTMGVHFLNMQNVGPVPDPAKPPVLIYEPQGDKLRLVAAEWFVPLATGVKEAPTIFDRKFDGPMDGHEPIMPKELSHYDLHVWLWKDNPKGVFAQVNPAVKCGNYGYTFIDKEPASAHLHH